MTVCTEKRAVETSHTVHRSSSFLHFHSLRRIFTTIVYRLFWSIDQIRSEQPKITKAEAGFRALRQHIRPKLSSMFSLSCKRTLCCDRANIEQSIRASSARWNRPLLCGNIQSAHAIGLERPPSVLSGHLKPSRLKRPPPVDRPRVVDRQLIGFGHYLDQLMDLHPT